MDTQALGTALAGLGLMFVAGSTWLQYRESRKSRNLTEYQINADLVRRAMELMPELSRVLKVPNDAVPPDERPVYVKFYLLYAQAWQASKFALQRDKDWHGMRSEFAYWAEQPDAITALAELRRTPEGWPVGFFDFVTAEVERLRTNRLKWNPTPTAVPSSALPGEPPASARA